MSFIFRTYAQIAADVREWSRRLPDDIVAVAGIPRSGTIVAAMLAEYRHIHLAGIGDIARGFECWTARHRRRIAAKPAGGRVLVIDDTCWTGRTIQATREQLAGCRNVEFGALYYGDKGKPFLDRAGRRLPVYQHTFEHNMLRDCLTRSMLFDMDGVLCDDWGRPDVGGEWDARYADFLLNARPLYRPCYRIQGIVTGRMEHHRAVTSAWLQRHGVKFGSLTMADFPSERDRERYGHARYKADVYAASNATLYVESHERQAREIHERTNRPVLCIESMTMHGGVEPDPWE